MTSKTESPGSFLRRMRRQRKLTLATAAGLMGQSVAALSRLERGVRNVDRDEVESAIAAYHLSPWVAYQLYSLSGFLPEVVPPIPDPIFKQISLNFLQHVALPAIVVDRFGYFLAWNGILQAMWQLPLDTTSHSMDDLFSATVRAKYGPQWRTYAVRMLWMFYLKSLPVANEDRFRHVVADLAARHGAEFVELWNDAQRSPAQGQEIALAEMSMAEQYDTEAGPIDYVMTSTLMRSPTLMEIYIFVPFGEPSIVRFRELERKVELGRVHISPDFAENAAIP